MAQYNGGVLGSLRYRSTETCAVTIINCFPYYDIEYYRERVVKDLKGFVRASKGAEYQQGVSDNIASTLMVTLNESQRKMWEELLLEHGFKRVSSFMNSREGNTVHMYLWCKEVQEDPSSWKMATDDEEEDEDYYEEEEEE